MTPEKLCELALEAMTHAYVPYSGYKVGAALLFEDGTVYQGCNIENASLHAHGLRRAERLFQGRVRRQSAISPPSPSAAARTASSRAHSAVRVCRQVMREFCEDDFMLYMITSADGAYEAHTLSEILPYSFSAKKHMG